jgi:hypothetical protein
MLGKWPFPNRLSEMSAWAEGLWIRRVLVRAQEGQLRSPSGDLVRFGIASSGAARLESSTEGQCPVQEHRAFCLCSACGSSGFSDRTFLRGCLRITPKSSGPPMVPMRVHHVGQPIERDRLPDVASALVELAGDARARGASHSRLIAGRQARSCRLART